MRGDNQDIFSVHFITIASPLYWTHPQKPSVDVRDEITYDSIQWINGVCLIWREWDYDGLRWIACHVQQCKSWPVHVVTRDADEKWCSWLRRRVAKVSRSYALISSDRDILEVWWWEFSTALTHSMCELWIRCQFLDPRFTFRKPTVQPQIEIWLCLKMGCISAKWWWFNREVDDQPVEESYVLNSVEHQEVSSQRTGSVPRCVGETWASLPRMDI